MEEKLISVVIPIYNVEAYLDRCVESVINQSYKNLEIILVDDGSPDRCPQMCDDWAKKDSRIKVIHKANGGLSDTRNAGIDIAKGEYITFIDSDDFVDVDMIKHLYLLSIQNNADVTMCQLKQFFDEAELVKKMSVPAIQIYQKHEILADIIYLNIGVPYLVVACGKLYKRHLFDEIRFPVGRLHEDEFTYYKILLKTNILCCSSLKMYYYYQRSGSIMSSIKEKNLTDLVDCYLEEYEILSELIPSNVDKNKILFLNCLRNLYFGKLRFLTKNVKDRIISEYKSVYVKANNVGIKNYLFMRFRWLYLILAKIKMRLNKK